MNYFKVTAILLISSIVSLSSCAESTDTDTVDDVVNQENIAPSENIETPTPLNTLNPTPQTTEPAQNAAGVWHYTCAKGCAGGAGSAVNCTTCGDLLVHNVAYHPAQNTPTTAPNNNMVPPIQNTPEPAQNATGVWHYTCQKGCAGGAGSALPCNTCGATLAHNAAYH